ncbi:P1 family peptidase [Methylovirgula sp. 4M-Z18]|uniref:P1 family peptidase n=1 Tax=Methylovirgula sp. 4M-Z18 TaxID=2293567 RepID=UPI000E2F2A7B|nr:P1 family peptidase [Methylovirgula sp. 4M-Z18]RFB78961.1 peptidase S58 family protein [Methylovirgula sp. 4M-Z18]
MRNLITDIAGIVVGNAGDAALASGVTALIFETPAVASIAIHGGAPGVRDAALLEPEMTVAAVDALVLSGGSAFGLDAMGGVQAHLRALGRGLAVGEARVPIVPGAILFDLTNGGDKAWGMRPPYWDLGLAAARAAAADFALGSVGAGLGARVAGLKGGLGSASARTSAGFTVGALAAVNALGQATIGSSKHFWAAPYEQGAEFGGHGPPHPFPADALAMRLKSDAPENTTIAIVATDAKLTKAQAKRLAVQAQDGMALALRPAHAVLDGDVVFAAATGAREVEPSLRDLTEIGLIAAECLARAIARGVFSATALPFPGALPDWRGKYG